jgi:hypothetical protein
LSLELEPMEPLVPAAPPAPVELMPELVDLCFAWCFAFFLLVAVELLELDLPLEGLDALLLVELSFAVEPVPDALPLLSPALTPKAAAATPATSRYLSPLCIPSPPPCGSPRRPPRRPVSAAATDRLDPPRLRRNLRMAWRGTTLDGWARRPVGGPGAGWESAAPSVRSDVSFGSWEGHVP